MNTQEHSISKILQVQVVYLFILSGLGLTLSFTVLYYFLGMYATASVLVISFIIGIGCLYFLNKLKQPELIAHVGLIVFLAIIVVANLEFGGFDNPNDAWFMVIVAVSGLLLTGQTFWFYAVFALGVSVCFYLFKIYGVEFPVSLTAEKVDILNLCNRIGTIITTAFLILLFRYERTMRERGLNENEQELFQLANYDRLTELKNRTYFAKIFEDKILDLKEGSQALLFIDLDSFKMVNDTYGHNVGDKLLTSVADRFKAQLLDEDVICRHGGDEFLVMPSGGNSEEEIEDISNNLIRSLSKPFSINGNLLHIGCSIGISFFPEHGKNYLDLLRSADLAMYRAKERGSEQFQIYNEELAYEINNKNQIALDLRNAVEKGDLELVYQPKVSINNNIIVGYEALMRWKSNGKTIEPTVFITIAEEYSLINMLGDWLLHTVCKQISEWEKQNMPVKKVAINVSAKQLLRPDFVNEVIRVTSYFGLTANHIEFELTESVFIESSNETLGKLKKLDDLGFTLVIDDYGTGYASLGYLKRFPVSGLKIDKSFIDEILLSEQDKTIVGSTIELSHQLGLEVVAEGVENDAQLNVLKELGCDLIHGYYYSKPLKASDVFKLEMPND